MVITEVKVFPVNEDRLKAYVSITIDDCFVVRDLKIIEGTGGLFVAMPSKKRKDGQFKDIAHPLNQETREHIEEIEEKLEIAGLQTEICALLAPHHRDELALLNTLLDEDRKAVVDEVRKEHRDDGPRVTGTLFGGNGLDPVTSTLTGDLRGWSRGTVFTLENGQRWRVIDGEYYSGKPLGNAKVVVSPGKISGWYLQVEGHNPRPKVQRAD